MALGEEADTGHTVGGRWSEEQQDVDFGKVGEGGHAAVINVQSCRGTGVLSLPRGPAPSHSGFVRMCAVQGVWEGDEKHTDDVMILTLSRSETPSMMLIENSAILGDRSFPFLLSAS